MKDRNIKSFLLERKEYPKFNCSYCGKLIENCQKKIGFKNHYCNKLCYYAGKKGMPSPKKKETFMRKCLNCSKDIEIFFHTKGKKFCNQRCRSEYNWVNKECIVCKNIFRSLRVRESYICSTECVNIYKSESYLGNKNPFWKGGKSFELYSEEFNDKLKKRIKERDECCLLCNISINNLKEIKRSTCIHHIDYNKKNNLEQNLICLCTNCHGLTNGNRNIWKEFFHMLLKERYGYLYSSDGKIIIEVKEDEK